MVIVEGVMLTLYYESSRPFKRSKEGIVDLAFIREGRSGDISNHFSCAFEAIPSVSDFQSFCFLKLTKHFSGSLIQMSKRFGSDLSGLFLLKDIAETYLTAF